MTTITQRHLSIDAVRGFAVLGILLMNIVGMGLPTFAYLDPSYWGLDGPADVWVWAVNYVLADGKLRGLFTMLFGASMLLIAERAEGRRPGPAATHYRRMGWLLVFGMLHAYLLFFGDILVTYAVAGMLIFPLRKLKPLWMIGLGAAILLALLAYSLSEANQIETLWTAIRAGTATPAQLAQWQEAQILIRPPRSLGEEEVRLMQGGFLEALQSRARVAMIMQLFIMPTSALPEALGQALIGAGLFRLGFFTLGWPNRAYGAVAAFGLLVALPITAALAWRSWSSGFDPGLRHLCEALSALPRPFVALAYASVLLMLVRAGRAVGLVDRLAAAGRMAFSNYLGTSIVTSFVFCGYGLGLYGALSRWELYIVVAGVWALMLLWSKPWLQRFHYGPFEWAWRSLVQWKPQPFVKRAATA